MDGKVGKALAAVNALSYQKRLKDYRLSTAEYLDRNFGPGAWARDPYTDNYYVWDESYTGPGQGYVVYDAELRPTPIAVIIN